MPPHGDQMCMSQTSHPPTPRRVLKSNSMPKGIAIAECSAVQTFSRTEADDPAILPINGFERSH